MILIKKILFLLKYQKAILVASQENYLDAIDVLNHAPFKENFFLYYLLGAFLYEKLGEIDTSLVHYDKAKYLIFESSKINHDEKNYLLKYINNAYINIYRVKKDSSLVNKYLLENEKLSFNFDNINKTIKNDFVIIN